MPPQDKTLFVGNLPFKATERDLEDLFSSYSPSKVRIITDQFTGHSRGFAFVDFNNGNDATAMEELDGSEFMGRTLNVSEAKPKPAHNDRDNTCYKDDRPRHDNRR